MNSIYPKLLHIFSSCILRVAGYSFALLLRLWMIIFLLTSVRAETAEKIAAEIMKSTVRVVTLSDTNQVGHGTGFMISDIGHIATNTHVIEGGTRHFIVYSDGSRVRIREAEIVAVSERADLAILLCQPIEGVVAASLASSEMAVGQAVSAVGFPGAIDTSYSWATLEGVIQDPNDGDGLIVDAEAKSDFQPAVFPGSVAKLATMNGVLAIFHSAKISPGNSGGPLIDAYGRVCGINTAFIPAEEAGADYPLAIDSRELIDLANKHSISIKELDVLSSATESHGGTIVFLIILFSAVLVGIFYMVRRKTSASVSSPVYANGGAQQHALNRLRSAFASTQKTNSKKQDMIRLSGIDTEGSSYDLFYHLSDLRQAGGRLLIGRKNDPSQLCLSHPSISVQHAMLSLNGGIFYLQDLNSANGTDVNGRRLQQGKPPAFLQHGYVVRLGEIELLFELL
jgi:hypothetical protein